MTAKQTVGSTAPDGSRYVTLTDGGGTLGSAILSAKTDQTTPGTTDLVTSRYSRLVVASGQISFGTTYSSGQNIGGLLTIATGMNSTQFRIQRLTWALRASTITATAVGIMLFSSLPTTTPADTIIPAFTANDLQKMAYVNTASTQSVFNGTGYTTDLLANLSLDITSDVSGNIYGMFFASNTNTYVTPDKLSYNFGLLY